MAQTRAEAVQMVISVMRDTHRLDRYLQVADDGHYHTTPDRTAHGRHGENPVPSVHIPAGFEVGEESEEECAEALMQELGRLVAQARE
jgi:hypothetical protein